MNALQNTGHLVRQYNGYSIKKILMRISILSVIASIGAYAMLCRTCTEGQCKQLADKYSSGFYKMKSDGCHYVVGPVSDLPNGMTLNEAKKSALLQQRKIEKSNTRNIKRKPLNKPIKTKHAIQQKTSGNDKGASEYFYKDR
jgi:hypothetical protein